MTEASGPQKSSSSPPTAASCQMSPQQEPSTGNVSEGHLDTTPGNPPPGWHHTGPGPGDHAPPTP